jgi:hypothetical protein
MAMDFHGYLGCILLVRKLLGWFLHMAKSSRPARLCFFGLSILLPIGIWAVDRVGTEKLPNYSVIDALVLSGMILGIFFLFSLVKVTRSSQHPPECLASLFSKLADSSIAENPKATCETILDAAVGICFVASGVSNRSTVWRASILLHDKDRDGLKSFALRNYPPRTELWVNGSVAGAVFRSEKAKPYCNRYIGDLSKIDHFERAAIDAKLGGFPKGRSMASLRLETQEGDRIGTLQVVCSRKRSFDRKKVGLYLEMLADLVVHSMGKAQFEFLDRDAES